jgi:LacI family transcriptional regulator
VEKQGYIPDYFARKLSLKSVNERAKLFKIGYISYTAEGRRGHPYFDRIIEGLVDAIEDKDCALAAKLDMSQAHNFYINWRNLCGDTSLDGLVLFGEIEDKAFLKYLRSQARYVISLYNNVDDDDIDFVGCDYADTIRIIYDYIKSGGYDEIGLIVGDNEIRSRNAVHLALSAELRVREDFCLKGYFGASRAHDAVIAALDAGIKPPRIVCCLNDEMAIGCMDALLERGYRVPEDVSVTGHDDIMRAAYCAVPLTTVRIYKEEIGRLAVTVLLERLQNKRKFAIKVSIPGKLIKRQSFKRAEKQ